MNFSEQKINRSYRIDLIRALSVLLVLMAHLFPGRFGFGIFGVDIFFVVSGFCITKSLQGIDGLNLYSKILKFYLKRIIRLFPSILAVTLLTILSMNFYLFENELQRLYKEISAMLLFHSNFFYMNNVDYFNPHGNFLFTHFWSLSTEEQFYFVYPLMLFLLTKRTLLLIFLFILVVAFLCNFFPNDNLNFYNPALRYFEIFLGASLLLFPESRRILFPKLYEFIFPAFLILLLLTYQLQLVSHFYTAIFICIITHRYIRLGLHPLPAKEILESRALQLIGRASFPIYLVHFPMIKVFEISQGALLLEQKVLLFFASILIGIVMYRFLEIPIQNAWNSKANDF